MRQDRKRTVVNKRYRIKVRTAMKKVRKEKSIKAAKIAYQALDQAAKKHVIHKNKASRLKSRLMKNVKISPKKTS